MKMPVSSAPVSSPDSMASSRCRNSSGPVLEGRRAGGARCDGGGSVAGTGGWDGGWDGGWEGGWEGAPSEAAADLPPGLTADLDGPAGLTEVDLIPGALGAGRDGEGFGGEGFGRLSFGPLGCPVAG
eukprot:CAMPEP_0181241890 /NCGR_PEP_ID=MMETSP1096-20121128/41376_1 /TAXON_ID=156174 ORGANISM="Chrysochromulina ericina, Strain CCMP281" /NCGR_SAMPLE_ID=MMETSP1096 /ASSEMBLY_ACC=CAM_ASM_000453 /LENGTH=126 /DNA_ID=CAMNT_0023338019 /DNA_START=332 /DNA_END=709 /DNA_ORIENTATION=-